MSSFDTRCNYTLGANVYSILKGRGVKEAGQGLSVWTAAFFNDAGAG